VDGGGHECDGGRDDEVGELGRLGGRGPEHADLQAPFSLRPARAKFHAMGWDVPEGGLKQRAFSCDAFGLIWFQKNWIMWDFQLKYMVRSQISPNASYHGMFQSKAIGV
jgi:hypothetical protein